MRIAVTTQLSPNLFTPCTCPDWRVRGQRVIGTLATPWGEWHICLKAVLGALTFRSVKPPKNIKYNFAWLAIHRSHRSQGSAEDSVAYTHLSRQVMWDMPILQESGYRRRQGRQTLPSGGRGGGGAHWPFSTPWQHRNMTHILHRWHLAPISLQNKRTSYQHEHEFLNILGIMTVGYNSFSLVDKHTHTHTHAQKWILIKNKLENLLHFRQEEIAKYLRTNLHLSRNKSKLKLNPLLFFFFLISDWWCARWQDGWL